MLYIFAVAIYDRVNKPGPGGGGAGGFKGQKIFDQNVVTSPLNQGPGL